MLALNESRESDKGFEILKAGGIQYRLEGGKTAWG
jgi:hypothetical protein